MSELMRDQIILSTNIINGTAQIWNQVDNVSYSCQYYCTAIILLRFHETLSIIFKS